MKWNLRLAAANRGIWKASELRRMLADRGMRISAGKMSGLRPNVIKLDELNTICVVLDCTPDELLQPVAEVVPEPEGSTVEQAAVGQPRAVSPRPRSGRTLPPR